MEQTATELLEQPVIEAKIGQEVPWPPRQSRRPLRVAMLLNNSCANDSRVIKEAEALALSGHEVCVFCRANPEVPESEFRNGVRYKRIVVRRPPIDRIVGIKLGLSREKKIRHEKQPSYLGVRLVRSGCLLLMSPFVIALVIHMRYARRKCENGEVPNSLRRVHAGLRAIRTKLNHFKKKSGSRRLGLKASLLHRARVIARWCINLVDRNESSKLRPFLNVLKNYWGFRLAMENTVAQWAPDVVHAHDLVALPAGASVKTKTGAALVYDAHEFATLEIENETWLARRYKVKTERRFIARIDGMVTVSRGFRRVFADLYKIDPPVVVYNTPPYEPENKVQRDVRSDLGLSKDTPLAVYVGGLNPRRALRQVAETLVHAPEFHIAKVGGRNPRYEAMLLEAAEEFGVMDRLHLLDGVAPDQIIHYIHTGDLSLITRIKFSLQQDFSMPNKLFESLFGKLPVVCGEVAEIRDFLNEHPHGALMNSLDPSDIARAMREVYEKRDELTPTDEQLAEMRTVYGWPAQAEKLVNLYESLPVHSETTK